LFFVFRLSEEFMRKPGHDGRSTGLPARASNFAIAGTAWPQPGGTGSPVHLTYGFINYTNDLSPFRQRTAVEAALAHWAAAAPIHFTEVEDSGLPWDDPAAFVPDIRIGWFTGDHGDGNDFDGEDGIIAHAFYPPPNGATAAGDVHFDDAETWSDSPGDGVFNITEVATHEIGHALGLAHELEAPSVMQPYYTGEFVGLYPDDIDGIRALYGQGSGSVASGPFPGPFDQSGDWRVGTSELLAYALAYVNDEPWPAHGDIPPADFVLRAGAIWVARGDGGYADIGGVKPLNWVSAQPPAPPLSIDD